MSSALAIPREGVSRRGRRYSIRVTRGGDVAGLVGLFDAVSGEGGVLLRAPGERGVMEETLALAGLLSQGGVAFTLDVQGVLAGHLALQRLPGPYERHVAELAILLGRDHRGEGLGRALIETGIDWARQQGLGKITLSVFPENLAATGLYRSLGFEEEGLRRGQIRRPEGDRDLAIMGLQL